MSDKDRAYYYTLKFLSREKVVKSLNEKIAQINARGSWLNLIICSVDEQAITATRLEWTKYYSDTTHTGFALSWEKIYHKFRQRPAYFDLAIWQWVNGEKVLQALAMGQPSNGKTHLVINWVERSFAPTYLKGGVLAVILACAEEYAKLLGCKRVLIKNPIDAQKYARYGYAQFRLPRVKCAYMCKEL